MEVSEAREAVTQAGITEGFYEFHCQSGPACDDQVVNRQTPEATRNTRAGAERQMIPLEAFGAERRILDIYAEPSLVEAVPAPTLTRQVGDINTPSPADGRAEPTWSCTLNNPYYPIALGRIWEYQQGVGLNDNHITFEIVDIQGSEVTVRETYYIDGTFAWEDLLSATVCRGNRLAVLAPGMDFVWLPNPLIAGLEWQEESAAIEGGIMQYSTENRGVMTQAESFETVCVSYVWTGYANLDPHTGYGIAGTSCFAEGVGLVYSATDFSGSDVLPSETDWYELVDYR
jgi:hypothetical protein